MEILGGGAESLIIISPKTHQKYDKENRKSLIAKDFRFLLRDSGLRRCAPFSLPPRAIIETEAKRHSADADAVFLAGWTFCRTKSL